MNNTNYPFISVATPTYNRRPFIRQLINNYMNQTYPKNNMEWIIIDDGEDKVKDIFDSYQNETNNSILNLEYVSLSEKIPLGKKRNLMNKLCKGDIIIYMDDDDYYPPSRVKHAVDMLQKNKDYLIAGCTELYIHFIDLKKTFKFGPYHKNHCTAATFSFKKELLKTCNFNESKTFAEESSFLNKYNIPVLQLDPLKTILVFNHTNNTCDRHKLLINWEKKISVNECNLDLKDIINSDYIYNFYTNINETLKTYEIKNDEKVMYKNDDGTSRIVEYKELAKIVNLMKQRINDLESENKNLRISLKKM
ncbi:hypothetical protein CL656_07255 [bacterium]|nr:hypothetical protein [bacterium]|tara:strand:- start:1653 stop:2573 length:921 start_codon:yes stop_codon:yes gene_type:complete